MLIPLLLLVVQRRTGKEDRGSGSLKNGSRTKLFSFAPLIRSLTRPIHPQIPHQDAMYTLPCSSCVLSLPNYSLLSHDIFRTRVIPVAGGKEQKIDNLEKLETALEHAIAGFQAKLRLIFLSLDLFASLSLLCSTPVSSTRSPAPCLLLPRPD